MPKKKIRLGLDVRILSQTTGGVLRCVVALLKGLATQPQFEVTLFSDTPLREEYKSLLSDYTLITLKNKKFKKYWKNYILPFYLFKHKIDLYHATWDKGVPVFAPCPTVMTIYGLYCISPGNIQHSRGKRISRHINLMIETRVCKKVFTISEDTKQDIVKYLRVRPEKSVVAYLDCDRPSIEKALSLRKEPREYCEKLHHAEYFISIVGILGDRRKNVPFIVRSFAKFLDRDPGFRAKYKLVLAGRYSTEDKNYQALMDLIRECRVEDQVVLTGHVDDDMLYTLLKGSKVMIFTSLFEGFGIPILEAFYLGVPVVTSDRYAMAEVANEGSALLVNPEQEDQLVEALVSICQNDNLRKQLVDKGFKRLEDFSWGKAVQKIFDVYADV